MSPRDPASGQATGKRQHAPLVVTKPVDMSSPLIFQALVNNENLTTVHIKFFGPGDQTSLSYTLTNAKATR